VIDPVGVLIVLAALALCGYTTWGLLRGARIASGPGARIARGPLIVFLAVSAVLDAAFVSYVIACYRYGAWWSVPVLFGGVLATRVLMRRYGWRP
jgi:hypothetical protein